MRVSWPDDGRCYGGTVTRSVVRGAPGPLQVEYDDDGEVVVEDPRLVVRAPRAPQPQRRVAECLCPTRAQFVQDAAAFEGAMAEYAAQARRAELQRQLSLPLASPDAWRGRHVVLENLSNMPPEWKDAISTFADTPWQTLDTFEAHPVMHRARTIWCHPTYDLAEHRIPPPLLAALQLPDKRVQLEAAFSPAPTASAQHERSCALASVTTARASKSQLETWNCKMDAELTRADRQEMRGRAVVRDAHTAEWRSITRQEACMAMGLPGDYLDAVKSERLAAVYAGSAFSAVTAAHFLSVHFQALNASYEMINYVDAFAGVGVR